jgi:hypothetical protein
MLYFVEQHYARVSAADDKRPFSVSRFNLLIAAAHEPNVNKPCRNEQYNRNNRQYKIIFEMEKFLRERRVENRHDRDIRNSENEEYFEKLHKIRRLSVSVNNPEQSARNRHRKIKGKHDERREKYARFGYSFRRRNAYVKQAEQEKSCQKRHRHRRNVNYRHQQYF